MAANHPLRILVAADGQGAEIYDGALAAAWTELGHMVQRFTWKEHFRNFPYAGQFPTPDYGPFTRLVALYYKAQNRLMFGPAVWVLNRALVKQAEIFRPDLVFLYRPTHIWPGTVKRLKRLGCKVAAYNNDDPFSPQYPRWFWRHFRVSLPHFNHVFAYRTSNLAAYQAMGLAQTSLLRSYYLPQQNFQILPRPAASSFACQVIFVGHYESDGRDAALLKVLAAGVNLKLYGTLWERSPHYAQLCVHMGGPIRPLYGADYNLALNSAQLALVFLSRLNSDTYTRRCFEIPITGTPMLAEYTDDLANNLFVSEREALYFCSTDELVQVALNCLKTPDKLAVIGAAGRVRVLKDGHSVVDRARQVLVDMGLG